MADTVLKPAPAARYARRHRASGGTRRYAAPSVSRRNPTARRPTGQESLAVAPPPIEARRAEDIAVAAVEACARALEGWAELSQRADLLHNAAATLRRTSGSIAAEVAEPLG